MTTTLVSKLKKALVMSTTSSTSTLSGLSGSTGRPCVSRIVAPVCWAGLDEQVECPVCSDFLIGTIQMCTRGHSVCQKCITSVSQCPLCRKEMSQVRNYFLEYFMENCMFLCKYNDQGCSAEVAAPNYHPHTENCHFREVECGSITYDTCDTILNFTDFIPHLLHRHKIRLFENGMDYCYRFPRDVGKIYQAPYAYIEYDEKVFFYNFATYPLVSENGINISIGLWWISCFNPTGDKTDYKCKIKIGSKKDKQLEMTWSGPVLDFRLTAEEVLRDKQCLSTTLPGLKQYCADDDKNSSFLLSHIESAEIFKVERSSLFPCDSKRVTILETNDDALIQQTS